LFPTPSFFKPPDGSGEGLKRRFCPD